MNPVTRFPLFLMGVYTGVLCLRHPSSSAQATEKEAEEKGIEEKSSSPLPWLSSFYLFPFLSCSSSSVPPAPVSAVADSEVWSRRATYQSVSLLLSTLIVWGIDTWNLSQGGGGILGSVWFQAIVPFSQLEVIVGLTRDRSSSLAGRYLRTPVGDWLGERSMAIYLVHYPLIFYLCWIIHGKSLSWPANLDCTKFDKGTSQYDTCQSDLRSFNDAQSIPEWGIPVVCVSAVLLAAFLYTTVETPCRKLLRK
jgi:hypothetical protein